MRVLLFQDRFVPKILAGSKGHTIRRTARCKPGDTLSLRRWTGKPYRSKQEEFDRQTCTRVLSVRIMLYDIRIGMTPVDRDSIDSIARKDGFVDFTEMRQWFLATHGLPFEGWLIEWGAK